MRNEIAEMRNAAGDGFGPSAMASLMDYDSYALLQKRYSRAVGNDYLMPPELRKRFDCCAISVAADDKALFLFERREGFTKLHFRLLDSSAKLEPGAGAVAKSGADSRGKARAGAGPEARSELGLGKETGVLAAFLTFRENRFPEAAANWLLGQGFRKTLSFRRLTATSLIGDLSLDGVENISADEAYAFFGEHFGAVEADLPCRELFEDALCIRGRDGELLGAVYVGQMLIVAVAPEARGHGLGSRLYRACAATKARDVKNPVFHEWIKPDNAPSLAMLKGLGFSMDNVLTEGYVLAP